MLLPFAAYAAVLMASIAAGLFVFIRHAATERAEQHVVDEAQILADAVVPEELRADDFEAPVRSSREAELDEFFRRYVLDDDIVKAQLFAPDGTLVYNTDPGSTPAVTADAGRMALILAGIPERKVTHIGHNVGAEGLRAIEGLVAVHLADGAEPVGVLEIYHDYQPVAADIRGTITPVFAILGVGLLLLYAALFPILIRTSRQLRRESARNDHHARHDPLTGLPNRRKFLEELRAAVAASSTRESPVAVMLMDLDRFKEINDTLGHHQGDAVLRGVAERLSNRLRGEDVVARLGGDEFAVLLRHAPDEATVGRIAAEIHAMLEQPFEVGDLSLVVDASVGVAMSPAHGDDADVLIQRADVAMYAAKAARTGFELYDAELDQSSSERLTLTGDLRRALANDELVVHYQPKATFDGKVVGVEALVRWQHPTLGLVPPDRFIPLAEHSGLIRPLTVCVLRAALDQLRRCREQGMDLTVAVNLSAQHLLDRDLPGQVTEMLREVDIPADRLELEITESSLMVNPKRAVEVLTRLGEIGVRIAIDDFGTGFSSLQYLKQLPVNVLKVDRTFVGAMADNDHDALIVRSTIDLGRNLGLQVVAEGVETTEIWDALADLGCDIAQGFLLARPMPSGELSEWLRTQPVAGAPATVGA